MSIAITTVRGGVTPSPAARLVAELSRIAAGLSPPRSADDEEPLVKVVFHLGGLGARPGWSLVQTSRFSKRHRRVQVQISVPQGLDGPALMEFVFRSLGEACDLAQSFFHTREIPFDYQAHLDLVARIDERYRAQRRRL